MLFFITIEMESAINNTKIKVEFNQEVENITRDVVTLKTKAGDKQYIKSVKIADDKKSIEIETYEALKDKTTYTAEVKVGDKVLTGEMEFVIGEAATIEVKDQIVPAGEATKIAYKVYDAKGLDITNLTTVEFASNDTITDGKVTLAHDESMFVELSTTKKDGTKVTSSRVKVTGKTRVANELTNYSLGNTAPNFEATDYKQDTTLALNEKDQKLHVEFKDQFGDKVSNATNVKFESLDPAVAIIDEKTGEVTPRKVGNALVKVSYLNGDKVVFTKTIELNVVATAEATKIVTEKDSLTIYSNLTDKTAKTKVWVEDQYEGKLDSEIEVTVKSGKDLVYAYVVNGELIVTNAGAKNGSATIELKVGKLTKTISVTVKESSEVVDYKLVGNKTVLDFNTSEDSTKENYKANQMELKVTPVDANGEVAGDDSAFSYVVTNHKGETVKQSSTDITSVTLLANQFVAGESYDVTVKVGTLTVDSFKFEVKDTRKSPEIKIKSNQLRVTDGELVASAEGLVGFNDVFETIVELPAGVEITDVDFVSTHKNILQDADVVGGTQGLVAIVQDGTTDIYVDTVTVTKGGDSYELNLNGEKIEVTVDQTARKVKDETELTAALGNTAIKSIELSKDIQLTSGLTVNRAVNIDGKGFAIDNGIVVDTAADAVVGIKNLGIKVSNIATTGNESGIYVKTASTINVDNVTIKGTGYGIQNEYGVKATFNITNSTFMNEKKASVYVNNGGKFTIKNNTFKVDGLAIGVESDTDATANILYNTIQTTYQFGIGYLKVGDDLSDAELNVLKTKLYNTNNVPKDKVDVTND